MIEVLFCLHLIVLCGLFQIVERRVGRIIALVFFVYLTIFTVLKPALLFYLDLYHPYSTNEEVAVSDLLMGSLIFLSIQYLAIRYFTGYRPSQILIRWCDVSGASPAGLWSAFAFFMVMSFVGSTMKFGDLGYLLSTESAFDATTSLANGSWYLNFIAESLFYGAVLVVSYNYSRMPIAKSFFWLVLVLALTYFWARMASRTGILVVLIAWLSCSFSIERQRKLNLVYIVAFGYLVLVLNYVGNLVRLGNAEAIDPSTAVFGAVLAMFADLAPVDNAVLLYSEMHKHQYLYFAQLLGALTPLVLIPSSIFPLKIPADKDSELNRILFPDGADTSFYHEGSTLTFTVPAAGYADAGFLGVVVASIVYAILLCVFIWIYRRGSSSAKFIASVSMLAHIVGFRLSAETLLMSFYTSMLFLGFGSWLTISLSNFIPSLRPAR